MEQFLPWMHAGSTQFSISPLVWVFWPGQPSWPSQTRFPMQWLQKSTMVIFVPDMPRTNIIVSVFIVWSQLLRSRVYYYFLLTLAINFIVRWWYFWHFNGSVSMSSHQYHSTMSPDTSVESVCPNSQPEWSYDDFYDFQRMYH